MSDGFVCAVNRDRDDYQVPLALYEAGLLTRFVTDFYAGDQWAGLLPRRLAKRRVSGLPSAVTRSVPASFLVQTASQLTGLGLVPAFRAGNVLLGRAAGREARRTSAHLYCYSPYLPPEELIASGTRRVIFEYHPLPGLLGNVLRDDFVRYPGLGWSQAIEDHSAAGEVEEQNVWRRADVIVCASTVTRASLVDAGCDPARITVIPYGFEGTGAEFGDVAGGGAEGRCDFLFVGQGLQRKGLHHLIEAWQRADLADATLTLVCWRIDPGIRAMIRSPSIRLLAHQSADALDALYRSADVFVMPSLIEGFGLVYLEALERGCFAIGTVNTGLPDLDLPSQAAAILPVGNLDALMSALAAARDRKRAHGFDRAAICATATRWRWSDFRAAIGEHARGVVG